MHIIRLEKDNMLNGPGVRLVVWFRGCSHHCDECHNPETWSFTPEATDLPALDDMTIAEILGELDKPYYRGMSLTGGCPFCQNLDELYEFLSIIKRTLPQKDIWCWAGELYEDLLANEASRKCLEFIDVLVDGPYDKTRRELTRYCGSTNQRIIDVQDSLKQNTVVLRWGWAK